MTICPADRDGVHHRGERGAVRGGPPRRLQGDNLGIPHGVSSLLSEHWGFQKHEGIDI